jgi:sulfur relay (sulfurtransferase) DsrC/TusE family protein
VKVVKLDKDGYLKNPEDWSEEVYRELLVLNGVQLNSKEHINEIKLIRQGYIFKGYTGRAVFRYVFRFCNCIEPANRLITQFKGLANLEIAAGLPKDTLKMS